MLLLLPIVYAATVIQTSLVDVIQVGRVAPDLLALVAVVWLLVTGGPRAFLVAGAIGLGADLISPGRVGPGMACFLLAGYVVTWLRKRLPLDQLVWQVVVVGLAVTVLELSTGAARWLLGESTLAGRTLLWRAAGVGIYTAGISLPICMVLGWLREPYLARRRRLDRV